MRFYHCNQQGQARLGYQEKRTDSWTETEHNRSGADVKNGTHTTHEVLFTHAYTTKSNLLIYPCDLLCTPVQVNSDKQSCVFTKEQCGLSVPSNLYLGIEVY